MDSMEAERDVLPGFEVSLSVLLNSMAVGVFVVDAAGHFLVVNTVALRMIGARSLDEVRGDHSHFHFATMRFEDGTPIPPDSSPVHRALAGEDSVEALELRDEADGGKIALRCQASPLRSPSGAIVGAVKVCLDVTKEYELSRVKDDFIRTAAHELKTPLAIIAANAERALDAFEHGTGVAPRSLEGLRRGIERADRLINSLLDLVDVQGGLFSVARAPVQLDELLDGVIARLASSGAARVRVTETSPITILGDEPRLRRAVQSVLDNALKYSPRTAPVEVALGIDGDSALLSIRDRGIGIPLDKQSHIFERYFRAHAGTPNDAGGLGVGLFVTKEIVNQNGGRIWFESSENQGTVFYFQFPLERIRT